jgi:hypothetical protein
MTMQKIKFKGTFVMEVRQFGIFLGYWESEWRYFDGISIF